MAALTDLASMKQALYRLMNTAGNDTAVEDFGSSADSHDDVMEYLLDHGQWDAQKWLVKRGMSGRWVKTDDFPDGSFTGADSDWQGNEDKDGGRYASLPDDFYRLAGDQSESALHEPDGDEWGHEIEHLDRRRVHGDKYWLENDQLWIAPGASPPGDLKIDWIYLLPSLSDNTTVDFPKDARPLIVAYAARRAVVESWVALQDPSPIYDNLQFQQSQADDNARRSRQPRGARVKPNLGRYFV